MDLLLEMCGQGRGSAQALTSPACLLMRQKARFPLYPFQEQALGAASAGEVTHVARRE